MKQSIDSRESQNIEFKSIWKDDHIKWVSGFANAPKLLKDIPNKVRDLLGILVSVDLIHVGNKDFLEIIVDAYSHPVSYKSRYYRRSGSTLQELKGSTLDRFLSPLALNHFRALARKSACSRIPYKRESYRNNLPARRQTQFWITHMIQRGAIN